MKFQELNDQQKQAVINIEGPVMILAGAGSGKTRTLVSRILYLIEKKYVPPYRILALTFSNKAAREMRERVADGTKIDLSSLQVTTFHAFCARLLRMEAHFLGLSRSFSIYDESESKAVVKGLLQKRGISFVDVSPYEILYYINKLKNDGHYMGRSNIENLKNDIEDPFYSYFKEYEVELNITNAIDFGGLITSVIQLFEKYPEVLKRYQERFRYVLIDEYQDTNRAQFELVKMLSAKDGNVCVVGDEDQSIYSWRGADIRNILEFENYFENSKIIRLEQNYRSSKNIIEASTAVISRNELRKGKIMWTSNPSGENLEVIECESDKKESEFVAQEIKKLKNNKDANYSEIAIFYRANSQSRLIEDGLRANKIPYRIIGGIKFYERKEIKDILAYLRIVINPKDNMAFTRIINVPSRGIGAITIRKFEVQAINCGNSLFDFVNDYVDRPEKYDHIRISSRVKSSLRNLVALINEAKILDHEKAQVSVICEKLLNESGYLGHVRGSKDYESLARLENLEELMNAIKQYERGTLEANITNFLETVTLDNASDEESFDDGPKKGEVSLMTVHGAKGLEYPYVFIAGAEENIFPSLKSINQGINGVEEERRLFYVAMTRAMKHLYILFSKARMLYGQLKFNMPSRFIQEIPDKYYVLRKFGAVFDHYFVGSDVHAGSGWDNYDFNQENIVGEESVYFHVANDNRSVKNKKRRSGKIGGSTRDNYKFPKGAHVIHSVYGVGEVVRSEGYGEDEKVMIKFKDGVKKKFMVKFAPLSLM